MTGDDHTAIATQIRFGDHDIPVAEQFKVAGAGESSLDRVGQRALITRDRLDVAELPGEIERGGAQVKDGRGWHARILGEVRELCRNGGTPGRRAHPSIPLATLVA